MDKDAVVRAIIALKNCAAADFAEQSPRIEECGIGDDEDALTHLLEQAIGLLDAPEANLMKAAEQIIRDTEGFLTKLGVSHETLAVGVPATSKFVDTMNCATVAALANFRKVAGVTRQ